MKRVMMALCAAALLSGCASMDATGQRNAAVKTTLAAQTRSMDVMKVEFVDGGLSGAGAGGTVTMTNVKCWTISNLLPALPYPPDERNVAEVVVDGVGKVAPVAAAAYLGGKALDNAKTTTVNNNTTTTTAEAATTP